MHNWLEPRGALSAEQISATYLDFLLHGLARD